ncbi:MAG: helix-turn-helix transcriptional regulator [Firmicutes bacterium]|nr:helix-turn-helix transcriptional regulator [Bacillota bacterium]
MLKFAQRLRELRLEKNLTQVELSKEVDISQSGITHWENEKRIPNALVIIAFAKFFDVTSDYLLGLTDD